MPARHRADELLMFAAALLERGGLASDRARVVAETLIEADLLGHTTHGLALLHPYLADLEKGGMARTGDPETIADLGAAVTWDGRRLPGAWLVRQAIGVARERIHAHPTVTFAIRRSHHIACLEAYLKAVTDAGFMIILACSDPALQAVVPHGGLAPRLTPNPIGIGIPTEGEPILIDISMSTTSMALTKRTADRGGKLAGKWLIDAQGQATDDARVLFQEPKGAMLPLGGVDLGYKGFALGLLVEALTNGLCGSGRAASPAGWSASVFLQLIDPDAFGGRDAFIREMQHIADACRDTPVAPGNPPVRLPGEAALARRRRQLKDGIELFDTIMPSLKPWAERYDVPMPSGM